MLAEAKFTNGWKNWTVLQFDIQRTMHRDIFL